MTGAPRVSVIIPSYRRPDATRAAVLSVLAQSVAVHEVIVVDDASDPPLALDTLTALDPRLRPIALPKNLGAAGARQVGVDAATGDVIAFLDSDDTWLPGKLAAQLPLLAPMTAVATGWRERHGGALLRARLPVPSRRASDFFAGCWFCPGSTVILLRETFDRIGPLDSRMRRLEDLDWFARFGLAGGSLVVAPVAGAVIAMGARAQVAPVEEAAALIRAKYERTNGKRPEGAAYRRHLQAYLDVERARAALNEKQRLRAAGLLAASFCRVPRPQVPLRRWWRSLPDESPTHVRA